MTDEERLARIRNEINDIAVPKGDGRVSANFHYVLQAQQDVPWLLKLVDNILPSLVLKNIEIDQLNQRVRELEEASIKRGVEDSKADRVKPWSEVRDELSTETS